MILLSFIPFIFYCEPDWGQRWSSHEWPWGKANKGRIKGMGGGAGEHSDTQCIILVKMQTALWLYIERFGCTQAEGMHRRQPAAHPKHRASMHQAHVLTCPPRLSVVMFPESGGRLSTVSCEEPHFTSFIVLSGYESDFFRDALTATGISIRANKLAVFMKSVVKVCFRLTWLELERFMALQVVCRHDKVFSPFCPPSSFTALCCRVVWERTFLTPRYINMKNSLRVFVPNTPTPLWLEITPLSADYLCTCTLKHFKNIAASLLRPTKRSSLSKLDAVVTTAIRAFIAHSQTLSVSEHISSGCLVSWKLVL